MNRFIPFALLLCFISGVCLAQDYETCIQVLGATGKTATQGGLTFSYTVGEPVITTLSGTSRIVTQGFHQPELCMLVSTGDPGLAAWAVEVFPNPTADFLTIRFTPQDGSALRASVFNLFGQVMVDNRLLNSPSGTLLDCSSWQPGVYFLQLQEPATLAVATVRFIRL